METLTIYDIKRLTEETSPYFFSRNTLKFFGQIMKDFKVIKQKDGRYQIKAICKNAPIKPYYTIRYFNPFNNKLEIS